MPHVTVRRYVKSISPSGGHGRGHRPAIQNRAAARHVQLQLQVDASLGLGGRVALAYPKWASLPVSVLPLLYACPKFQVPTSEGGRCALTSLGQSQLAVYYYYYYQSTL